MLSALSLLRKVEGWLINVKISALSHNMTKFDIILRVIPRLSVNVGKQKRHIAAEVEGDI